MDNGSKKHTSRHVSSRNSDSASSTTNGDGEKAPAKKIPPIKAPVGLAKGPDLKSCKSKVGSMSNIKHTPSGGGVTIPSQKLKWNAKSKIGSLDNKEHKPGGGNLKVETRKLEWSTTSKVQSLQNVNHKPGGGNVKIFDEKYVEKSEKAPTVKDQSDGAKSLTKNMKGLSLA